MTRVLHVLHHIYHYPCGYRTRTEYLLQQQRELGLEVSLVTSADHEGGSELPDPAGLSAMRTTPYRGVRLPIWRECRLMHSLERRVTEAIRQTAPDIVHAHSPVLVSLPAWRAARRAHLPFVYELRDLWENAAVDLGRFSADSIPYRAARSVDTFVLRRAHAVVTICETMRHAVSARTGSPAKVFTVPNGVDVDLFDAATAPGDGIRSRFGLENRDLLAYVGTFQPYEGLELLVTAMPELVRHRPRAHLLIAGNGTQEETIRRLIAERRLESMVTMAGRLPHADVAAVYQAADLLVYPRTLTRTTALTTPLKPLEAMAMGKAVVASDVPGLQELIMDGRTGLLFRAGVAEDLVSVCSKALADPALRMALGAQAREWVRGSRTWGAIAPNYRRIYEHAVCSSGRGA